MLPPPPGYKQSFLSRRRRGSIRAGADVEAPTKGSLTMTIRYFSGVALIVATVSAVSCGSSTEDPTKAPARVAAGQQTFRYETFGDETTWTEALQLEPVTPATLEPRTI